MKRIRCKNKQCGNVIAYVNGNVPAVTCDKCGTVRKLYYQEKRDAIRLTMKF